MDALSASTMFRAALGNEFVNHYISVRRHEIGHGSRPTSPTGNIANTSRLISAPNYCSSARHSLRTGMSRPGGNQSTMERSFSCASARRSASPHSADEVAGSVQLEQARSLRT